VTSVQLTGIDGISPLTNYPVDQDTMFGYNVAEADVHMWCKKASVMTVSQSTSTIVDNLEYTNY
jgi:hypothetical protein